MVETLHERLLALAKEKYEKTIVRQVRHEALATMDVLTRHYADSTGFECMGCGLDAYEEYRVKDIDNCPEIRARAVAYGLLTPEEVFSWSYDG